MAYTLVLHVSGDLPVVGEVDELPKPTDTIITLSNPRQRDGKDLHYLEPNVVKVIWPIDKVTLIEVLESEEEEKIIGFVRE
ncbi:MAG: hypothetical protein M1282_06470 [Chloroflexi bacterium]|nr:hypothetical protein [Chloroflexota bacterium]